MRLDFNIEAKDYSDILKYYKINPKEALFFDIETTGFTAKTSKLYMIGAVYFENESGIYKGIQWFDEDGRQLKSIVDEFFEFTKDFSTLIHFNGDRFDIPYMRDTANNLGIISPLDSMNSLDIYKKAKCLKPALKLENVKQKSVEKFLRIYREDQMSGGDLIEVYRKNLAIRSNEAERLLLLHNRNDIEGLVNILPILSYSIVTEDNFKLTSYNINDSDIELAFEIKIPVPIRVATSLDDITLNIYENEGVLKIPFYKGVLKFFYEDYKNYYYLPLEDEAMHKSVATFVDKEYRENAKASNCYSKKEGVFMPQYEQIYSQKFLKNYNDKISYFEKDLFEQSDSELIGQYIAHIVRLVLTK
ncbi:MAG: ribonuclease H-like domain-containing protein [Lachnospiraceae bacterium]|nr:ribonuclease H-like domain-containing protein [Lachnospiraceae bacterium]